MKTRGFGQQSSSIPTFSATKQDKHLALIYLAFVRCSQRRFGNEHDIFLTGTEYFQFFKEGK